MIPIDRALGRFAALIHGPTPAKSTPTSVPVLPLRLAACEQQKGNGQKRPGREQGPRKSVAQLRKEIAKEFWVHLMCGNCVHDPDNSLHFEHPSTAPRPENEEERESTIRQMEMEIEQHVANRHRQGLGIVALQNVEQMLDPFRPHGTEPEIPVSSLEISKAADAISAQHQEVAEAVVELHMSRVASTDAKSDTREIKTASPVDARLALIHALGCKLPAMTAIPARLCQPLTSLASPMTTLPDRLSPVSDFLARMTFEETTADISKPQQTLTEATSVEEEQDLRIHTEL